MVHAARMTPKPKVTSARATTRRLRRSPAGRQKRTREDGSRSGMGRKVARKAVSGKRGAVSGGGLAPSPFTAHAFPHTAHPSLSGMRQLLDAYRSRGFLQQATPGLEARLAA